MALEPFCFDRTWLFPLEPEALWGEVTQIDEFPRWWGWLRSFETEGLDVGARTSFVVQSALPIKLRFELVIEEIVEPSLIRTTVTGDLRGPAQLEIAPASEGSDARLVWELEPTERVLRTLTSISRGFMSWSHDQVVRIGVEQFRRRLG